MRRHLLFLTSLATLAGCADGPTRVSPADPALESSTPSFDIVDGARGGAAGFYWLPPIVTSLPTSTGTFDNTVLDALDVELCELGGSECAPSGLSRRFTSTTGSFVNRVRLFPDRQYQVMYASTADNLDPATNYRVTVRAHGVALGFVDIDVVSSLTELRTVDRTRFAALFRGQSLPISFRVDDVFPAACGVAAIDALADQLFGAGAENDAFRLAIRRLAYLQRFGTTSEVDAALQELADELDALEGAALGDAARLALIAQLRTALYCVVGRPVPPPPVEVTGTVTGTNGRGPLAGVSVRVDPEGLTGATDAAGLYRIAGVPVGPVTVSVTGGLPAECSLPPARDAVAGADGVTVDIEVPCEPPPVAIVPTTLTAGVQHACGLTTDGAAYCWGNGGLALGAGSSNGSTVPVPVSGGLRFTTISAGDSHTCGVTVDGAAYCWGLNTVGTLGDGTQTQRSTPVPVSGGLTFASVSAGNSHTCGITQTGAAYCWGLNFEGRLGDGTTTGFRTTPVAVLGGHVFKSIAVSRRNTSGQGHSCGVTTEGEVYCWGNNSNRQLGAVTPTQSPVPLKVPLAQAFTSVVAGTLHTCALASDGKVFCWGFGPSYAPPGFSAATPVEASAGLTFTSLAAGIYHTCGLTAAGEAYCFGTNSNGELGDGTSRSDGAIGNPPVAVNGGRTFAALAAGDGFTCGVTTSGAAFCWGTSRSGELGDGSNGRRSAPVPVLGGLTFNTMSSGGEHTCGVTAGGSAFCWGDNGNLSGRLGDGTGFRRHAPRLVSGGLSFASVVGSPYAQSESQRNGFSCGLTVGGETYCWGGNFSQQLGVPGGNRLVPNRVDGVPAFAELALGAQHSCARTDAGAVYCWGGNFYGMLGRGTLGGQSPGTINGALSFTELVAGAYHTCGLTVSGAAHCWGRNNRGQLGDGTSGTDRSEPVPVSGGLSFVSLAAGFEHTCGVTAAGAAYCWGYNNFGQLGSGTSGPSSVTLAPTPVGGGHSFATLAAGDLHTCGVTIAGTALCWGWNQDGQLGEGTTASPRTSPVMVEGGLQFTHLDAGRSHSCGLATTGLVYCWGLSEYGRVGDEYIRQVAGGLTFRQP